MYGLFLYLLSYLLLFLKTIETQKNYVVFLIVRPSSMMSNSAQAQLQLLSQLLSACVAPGLRIGSSLHSLSVDLVSNGSRAKSDIRML